jgi:hypothetical protein
MSRGARGVRGCKYSNSNLSDRIIYEDCVFWSEELGERID